MWFLDVGMTFIAVFTRALSVAAVTTDDRLDVIRLPASAALLTVLHVVCLHNSHAALTSNVLNEAGYMHFVGLRSWACSRIYGRGCNLQGVKKRTWHA